MTITNPTQNIPPLVGQVVKATVAIYFIDGTTHHPRDEFTVTEANEAYFQLFLNKGYTLVNQRV